MKMRCLITGASGQLGARIAHRLLADGHHVFAMVRPQSNLSRLADILSQITLVRANLSEISSARDAINQLAPQAVIHAAWSGVTADTRNDSAQITQNVTGTLQLLDIAAKAGCRHWIGIGSQAEYGPQSVPLTETLTSHPTTAYGISKLCSGMLTEKMCALAGIRFAWVRLLATYGPDDDFKHLIPSVIEQLLAGAKPSLTPGTQKWDYLYVNDAADAIAALLNSPAATGTFNLGSGHSESVRRIVEQIRDLIDPHLPLGFGERPCPPEQIMLLQADISRLTAATGWKPATSLRAGLEHTIEWHKSQKTAAQAAKGCV